MYMFMCVHMFVCCCQVSSVSLYFWRQCLSLYLEVTNEARLAGSDHQRPSSASHTYPSARTLGCKRAPPCTGVCFCFCFLTWIYRNLNLGSHACNSRTLQNELFFQPSPKSSDDLNTLQYSYSGNKKGYLKKKKKKTKTKKRGKGSNLPQRYL